jgi:Domain of unknown function (4846)
LRREDTTATYTKKLDSPYGKMENPRLSPGTCHPRCQAVSDKQYKPGRWRSPLKSFNMDRKWFLSVLLLISLSAPAVVFAGSFINARGATVGERFIVPAGYTRISVAKGSFGEYLRNLKLRPDGAVVHFYDGSIKKSNGVYVAVIDMPIGNKNLQQCADVIMHTRAEYLYMHGRFAEIHFTFTNGFRADYSKWRAGYRVSSTGGRYHWVRTAAEDNSRASFDNYMDMIYGYCGTLSLSKELKNVQRRDIRPGDILIKGGSPGHAELVLDVATNRAGENIYLLAQGYMPAQEMQVLENPEDRNLSPWYKMDEHNTLIITPQWTFTIGQLMRFEEE